MRARSTCAQPSRAAPAARATFTAALPPCLRYRAIVVDRAVTLEPERHAASRPVIAAPPRRIRTGPLPTLPRGGLAPIHGFEGKLPLLILAGFAVLAAIQLGLAW